MAISLTLETLDYPGLFAYRGEKGYVEVFRTRSHDKDNDVNIVVEGADENGIEAARSEFPSIETMLAAHPFLNECEFVKRESSRMLTRALEKIRKDIRKKFGGRFDIKASFSLCHKVSDIRLGFSNKIWGDLANKEGKLLPACCANVSAIRDEFISAQREDGWMRLEDVQSLVINMSGHDYPEGHPVHTVAEIYKMVEEFANIPSHARSRNPNDPEDACSMIYHFGAAFAWDRIMSGFGGYEDHLSIANGIYTCLPAIFTLYHKMKDLHLGDVDGFALVNATNNEVYNTRRTLAIFPTQAEAEKVLAMWVKTDQVKPGYVSIRPVRVSIEKGIEFLEEIKNPWIAPEKLSPELSPEENKLAENALRDLENKLPNERAKIILRKAKQALMKLAEEHYPEKNV